MNIHWLILAQSVSSFLQGVITSVLAEKLQQLLSNIDTLF